MTSRLRRPAGALLAGVLATSVLASMPTAHAIVLGSLAGTVTDADLLPLANVDVAALQEFPNGDDDTYWAAVDFGQTDDNGEYLISGLEDGTYRVEFGDRLNPNPYASEFYDDQATVLTAEDIAIDGHEAVAGVDAILAPESTITGTVTGAADQPLGGAGVFVYEHANGHWAYLDEMTTNGSGQYTLSHLPRGTYRVEFQYETPQGDYLTEAYNNKGDVSEADDIVVGVDVDVTSIDAKLVAGEHDPVPFVMTGLPTISGTPQVGSMLTVTGGSWVPTPASTEYYWFRGEDYTGVSGTTYVPSAADLGKTLSVLVQVYGSEGQYDFANTGNYGPIVAAPVAAVPPVAVPAPVPAPAPVPVISFSKKIDVTGALTVGSTLKLKNFKALVTQVAATASYKIQWYAGSKKIKKATKPKLKVAKSLRGKKISVKVTAIVGTTTETKKVKVGKIR